MRLGKKRAGAFHNACFGLCGFCLLFGLFAFSVVSPQTITNSTIFKLNVIAHRIEENVPVFKEIKSRRKVPKLSHPLQSERQHDLAAGEHEVGVEAMLVRDAQSPEHLS